MRQLVQDARGGTISLLEVPRPSAQEGMVVVRNAYSLISTGTERASQEFARKSLLGKARSRPDLVAQVRRKFQREGLWRTLRSVQAKLSFPQALGYSCAGIVEEVGPGVTDLRVGDAAACAGAGYACHAEWVAVPRNLVAKVPDGVALSDAAWVTVGAIALQGVRVASPRLGERCAVIGLGLLGLLTVQLLEAAGVEAVGVDLDPAKVDLARKLGAHGAEPRQGLDPGDLVQRHAGGLGFDHVIVTASTDSDDPVQFAAEILRRKGVITIVGDVGMRFERRPLYFGELEIRMSMSYGPGRYDRSYEEGGLDYPVEYVRWSENRNMEAFLELVRAGRVRTPDITTHTFGFGEAVAAYGVLSDREARPLGILLRYADAQPSSGSVALRPAWDGREGARLGLVGAGEFARAVLLPALRAAGGRIQALYSARGLSARVAGEAFGAARAVADAQAIWGADDVDAVLVLTRHDSHARYAVSSLQAGKACFVEKPLAISEEDLDAVEAAWRDAPATPLMTGFNRRYSPAVDAMCAELGPPAGPRMIWIRVQAGRIPLGHWVQDPAEGGGRLVGEVCHFLDLARWIAGTPLQRISACTLGAFHEAVPASDNLAITMQFADGSVAHIQYGTEGGATLPKEMVEVSAGGVTWRIDDYRKAERFDSGHRKALGGLEGKGHREEMAAFLQWVRGGASAEPPGLCLVTSRYPFLVLAALRSGSWVEAPAEQVLRGD